MAQSYYEFPIDYNKLSTEEPIDTVARLSGSEYFQNKKLQES